MKILVCAFLPFGDFKENSSYEALEKIYPMDNIYKLYLPVSYLRTKDILFSEINRIKPDRIILLGQAGNTAKIRLESQAINLMGASIPDADGVLMTNRPIDTSLKDVYETKVDIEGLKNYLMSARIDTIISDDCGKYLCNKTYFDVLSNYDIPTIFIHFPLYVGQSVNPKYCYLDMLKLVRTIELTINFMR